MTVLDRWAVEEPNVVASIYELLMDVLQKPSVSESLLEAVTWATHSKLSIDLFDNPSPDSRVFAAAPNLIPLLDESGLVTVTDLDARPWGLHTGNYAFQYHQLLRRGFGSNIHYELIGTVLRLAKQHDLIARFALDDRRLRYKDEYEEWEERDFWYGRSLVAEDLDNLSAVGETFHGDPDGGTSWLHPYAGLSVRWTADGPLKGVEIEEFMPPPKPGAEWVFARYLHAIRDTERKAFVHCDGAVKAFAAAQYPMSQQGFRTRGKGTATASCSASTDSSQPPFGPSSHVPGFVATNSSSSTSRPRPESGSFWAQNFTRCTVATGQLHRTRATLCHPQIRAFAGSFRGARLLGCCGSVGGPVSRIYCRITGTSGEAAYRRSGRSRVHE